MMILFFVYTPLQLYFAQEIIRQEKLTENILLKGYVGTCNKFLEMYEFLKVPQVWQKEYLKADISNWLDVNLHKPISSIFKIRNSYKEISQIIKENEVGTIYFGDINNSSCRLAANIFSRQGIKICFFEEGASHYSVHPTGGMLSHRTFWARLFQAFFDLTLFIPVFRQRLGYWAFVKPMQFSDMHIDIRFSVIPKFKETFDRKLTCAGAVGEKAKALIADECVSFNVNNSILFLDQPIYEVVRNSVDCYLKTIDDSLATLPDGTNVVIKYHPRETDYIKHQIEELFNKRNIKFFVISQEVNLPIEFYLQQIQFRKVLNFYTSSALYNGYLFEKIQFEYLIENFYYNCLQNGLKEAYIVENIIKEYKENIKTTF